MSLALHKQALIELLLLEDRRLRELEHRFRRLQNELRDQGDRVRLVRDLLAAATEPEK